MQNLFLEMENSNLVQFLSWCVIGLEVILVSYQGIRYVMIRIPCKENLPNGLCKDEMNLSISWYRHLELNPKFYLLPQEELWNRALFFPEIYPEKAGSQTWQLIWYLRQARKCLKVAIYTSSFRMLEKSVFEIVKNKVEVVVVTDNSSQMHRWRRQGVNIVEKPKLVLSPYSPDYSPKKIFEDHMHNKFAIIDDKAVLTGSLNWTKTAVMENRENVMVTDDKQTVEKYIAEFDRLLESCHSYKKNWKSQTHKKFIKYRGTNSGITT